MRGLASSAVRLVTALDARLGTALAFMRSPVEAEMEAREDDASTWLSTSVETMTAALHTRGLTVSSIITEGDPKHVLLNEAKQWGADSIFLGARGLSGVERFLLGNVSAAIAARAHCSVEVVRPALSRVGVGEESGREHAPAR